MTLASKLFRSDRQLQSCAVNDQSHLTQGTSGEHVAKVQMALSTLDRAVIDRTELAAQRYGASTARAVLAYKTRRRIINTAYQSQPDDIVGKMTIAQLDKEMFLFESTSKATGECDATSAGPAPLQGQAFGVAPGKPPVTGAPTAKPRLNTVLRVYCSITKRALVDTGFPLRAHVEKARDLMADFGLTLSLEFGPLSGTSFGDVINFPFGSVGEEEIPLLRKASEDTRPGSPKILRVIVCPRARGEGPGDTFRNVSVGGTKFAPFVLLNSNNVSRDNSTLLHEMIHASLDGPDHDVDDRFSVFFQFSPERPESPDRVFLPTNRAISLSKAFYKA